MTTPTTTQPSGIVTPEAVLLEFETAGVGSRGIAKIVDLFVQLFAMSLLLYVVLAGFAATSSTGAESGVWAAVASILIIFLVIIGYPIAMEAMWNGRTLGKAAMGLRVVTREGAPTRFRHAFLRGIIGLVEVYAFTFICVLTTAMSRNNQRVGDMAAGTIVMRERKADRHAVAVSFPPPMGLEAYVQSIDVSAMTGEQYSVIRSFLMRVFEFTPEARMALALRLANPVAIELNHTPPPALGPELFLACVAAAYQARHGGPASTWGVPAYTPGYGAPGYAGAGYGTPGYGTPAYGTPGYGAATGYAPAYGASPYAPSPYPDGSAPPPPPPPPSGPAPSAKPPPIGPKPVIEDPWTSRPVGPAGFGGLSGPAPAPSPPEDWPTAPPTAPPAPGSS